MQIKHFATISVIVLYNIPIDPPLCLVSSRSTPRGNQKLKGESAICLAALSSISFRAFRVSLIPLRI